MCEEGEAVSNAKQVTPGEETRGDRTARPGGKGKGIHPPLSLPLALLVTCYCFLSLSPPRPGSP